MYNSTRICRQQSTTPSPQQETPQPFFGPALQAKEKERGGEAWEGFEAAMATSGKGESLPAETRGLMENKMGADFGNVRVHHGAAAAGLSSSIQAKAFTYGNDIYFNNGEYAPESGSGRHLLAHELTHVMQQNSGRVQRRIQRAEYATYISSLGKKRYLEGAKGFFKNWGYPNIKQVSTMSEVFADLGKATADIDKFRIVSHANPGVLDIGMMSDFSPKGFGDPQTQFTNTASFNALVSENRIMDDATYSSWAALLLADPATKPLLAAMNITATPAVNSEAGIVLRAHLESAFLNIAELDPSGGPVTFKNRGLLNSFITKRVSAYSSVLKSSLTKPEQTAFTKAMAALPGSALGVLKANNQTVKFTKAEADTFGDGLKNAAGTGLAEDIGIGIREGTRSGSYLKNLEAARKHITKATHVEIRGCNAGWEPNFLTSLSNMFGAPGNQPTITAPDLFEFFFDLNYTAFSNNPVGTKAMQDLWTADPQFGKDYNLAHRLRSGDIIQIIDTRDTDLDKVIKRYSLSLTASELKQLNPQISDYNALTSGSQLWLKARRFPVDSSTTKLDDFCTTHLGSTEKKDEIQKNNPGIKDPDKLTVGQMIELSPAALAKKTGYASGELAQLDYEKNIRGGEVHMHLKDPTTPELLMDEPGRQSAFAKWLEKQDYGFTKESAADMEKKMNAKGTGGSYFSSRFINFLTKGYPNIEDPVLPDDPRYKGHIIKRP